MKYKYQMHAHTYPCSDCSKISIEELVESLREGGYQGCVLTNHFLHGNTGLDRSMPWEEFVREYELDYMRGKRLAEKYGLDLIFGIEEGVDDGVEILCYGITPQILYSNPSLSERSAKKWHDVMSSYGVLTVQAHPYRKLSYIPESYVLPHDTIDGIEVFNFSNSSEENEKAREESLSHPEWILSSGADTHTTEKACHAGIECDVRITNEKELVEVLKSGEYNLILK